MLTPLGHVGVHRALLQGFVAFHHRGRLVGPEPGVVCRLREHLNEKQLHRNQPPRKEPLTYTQTTKRGRRWGAFSCSKKNVHETVLKLLRPLDHPCFMYVEQVMSRVFRTNTWKFTARKCTRRFASMLSTGLERGGCAWGWTTLFDYF